MSDREQRGLRGSVKSCTEENAYTGVTKTEGKTIPRAHSEHTTNYDAAGRLLAVRNSNSDGSQWVTRLDYDAAGRLLKTTSGVEGQVLTETTYFYDREGRLQTISGGDRPDSPVTFRYDDNRRKSKIEVSRAEDYRPGIAEGGSPFEVEDRAPNLPGGGTATTIYDEHDRAIEVQVRDASGELVKRAVRTYDTQGHILEEKQIWDDPVKMFPAEAFANVLEQSGLPVEQMKREVRTQLSSLMAGHLGPYSVSYKYDAQGRVTRTSRRIFNNEDDIETTYNDHGDVESEVTRSTRVGETNPTSSSIGLPSYSEVRYSYKYDARDNWIEKATSYCSNPDTAFQPSTVTKRTLTYY